MTVLMAGSPRLEYSNVVQCLVDIWRYEYNIHYKGDRPIKYMRISKNHNSLGCEQPLGLDVNQSPNAQDVFQPIPGLISCAMYMACVMEWVFLLLLHNQERISSCPVLT